MHPIRRRKKRPNYGVRTIEVSRGKNGFGFTISGQQPCILSCIVSGSPAERAGLRAGDYLVAVNGQSVGKLPHDDVVKLIGCSNGILKLQIAENYYSDSSDEDAVAAARSKPKYVHKPRTSTGNHRANVLVQNRARLSRDFRSNVFFDNKSDGETTVTSPMRAACETWDVPALPPPRPRNASDSKPRFCFILGYLGTIEMPKQIPPGCRSQVVRGCIKRLRAEKRSHTWVRMKIHSQGITLAGNGGKILAEYPANRITYCGSGSEEDKKFLGLVTTAVPEDGETSPSSSCHVFAVQANVYEHHKHAAKAASFKVICLPAYPNEGCAEFPATSEPVLNAVRSLNPAAKIERNGRRFEDESFLADSPQPSQAGSTAASSNSDSGIGFRDDCGNQSDRIVMVDVENQRLHIRQLYEDPRNVSGLKAFACAEPTCALPFVSNLRKTPRTVLDSNAAVSNRSRSPLDSPAPSSDDDRTAKHDHSEILGRSKRRAGFAFSRSFLDEEINKSLLPSNQLRDRSIFYRLGLLPDLSESCHDSAYGFTSRSFDDLERFQNSYGIDSDKSNSKSTDDVMHIGDESFENRAVKGEYNKKVEETPMCCDNGNLTARSESSEKSLGTDDPSRSKESVLIKKNYSKSSDDIMSICTYKSDDALLCYKLSPKVFGSARPSVTQSMENLKGSDDAPNVANGGADSLKVQHGVSLQDLRSFSDETFQSSLVLKDKAFDEKEIYEDDNPNAEGVVSWSASFEKLLEDPSGLHIFAEFLKKEFSQENIVFWVSCEKYRKLEDEAQRKKLACRIFDTHLSTGATEPVNVDAHAHQSTQDKLSEAPADLFLPAQKQIFNLMKFDSYPRFIKSELYKECLLRELAGEELPYSRSSESSSPPKGDGENSPNRGKLKKSRSDAEDCRRKSLLPWHRKNRSKSKDRGESEYKLSTLDQKRENEDVVSVRSEITSSRSSLASWDLALRGSFSRQSITSGDVSERESCFLCRVILSDGATTVVQVGQNETVRELIHRLLEKRGLQYSSFEVYVTGSPKPLALDEEASSLGNKEVRVEQRVVFRLDLPNRKTVSVKAKATKTLGQVLRSILHKYSYRLEAVTICSMSENEVLDFDIPISAVDGKRLTVLTRSTEVRKGSTTDFKSYVKAAPTLDEITNKVFEEVLQGKSDIVGKSDQGSTKSEEWGSEHSSGIFGKFLRRDSAFHEKSRSKSRGTGKQILEGASRHVEGVVSMVTGKPPLIGKWKQPAKVPGKSESDELYEGLKRAQRSRLEDQRGTEINFELPDFLKDKDDAFQSGKKVRKTRREEGPNASRFYDGNQVDDEGTRNLSKANTPLNDKLSAHSTRSVSPNPSEANHKSEARKLDDHSPGRTITKPLTCKTYETPKTTPINSDNLENSVAQDTNTNRLPVKDGCNENNVSPRVPRKSDPPPLPPKPKYLPPKSTLWNKNDYISRAPQEITNRNINFIKPSDIKKDTRFVRNRRAVYLDQPSSSFV